VLEAERLERVDVVAPSMAGTIALELALGGDPRISQEEFSPAFRRSPMQRAKLRGLERNAVVVPGDVSRTCHAPLRQAPINSSHLPRRRPTNLSRRMTNRTRSTNR
jgi:hypothetical protein